MVAVHKNSYRVALQNVEIPAEATGHLLYAADSPLELPTVGDWTEVQVMDDHSFAVIHTVLPRRSLMLRKTAGKRIEQQAIAANIDVAFIVQSADADFNLRRLERYLVVILESAIEPIFVLSKADRVDSAVLKERLAMVQEIQPTIPVIALSAVTGVGIDELEKRLSPDQTCCLIGSSGVGKTTLINRLLGEERLKTAAVRDFDQKGRHTTSSRQLFALPGGAWIIDTPGMRELGTIGQSVGIESTFADVESLAPQCRFADCTHVHERGCAVIAAVESGEIDEKRYQNYLKLRRESEYYERSYSEKRKRDKQFGKFVKTVLKHHPKR